MPRPMRIFSPQDRRLVDREGVLCASSSARWRRGASVALVVAVVVADTVVSVGLRGSDSADCASAPSGFNSRANTTTPAVQAAIIAITNGLLPTNVRYRPTTAHSPKTFRNRGVREGTRLARRGRKMSEERLTMRLGHPHHHSYVDMASASIFGVLVLMFTAIVTLLRDCSAVLTNLSHVH